MYMKRKLSFLILCINASLIFAQNTGRLFKDANFKDNNVLEVTVNDGVYRIQAYSKAIIETSFIPSNESYNKASHAVILKPQNFKVIYKDDGDTLHYNTEGLSVKIQKQPFQISYLHQGQSILSEKKGYAKNNSLETIQFNLKKEEILYGGGARVLGMNRRGHRLELYNKAHYGYETESKLMNFTLPIVLSSNRYMVHFDNAPIGFLDLDSKQDNTLTYETISGRKTYQVIVGIHG